MFCNVIGFDRELCEIESDVQNRAYLVGNAFHSKAAGLTLLRRMRASAERIYMTPL